VSKLSYRSDDERRRFCLSQGIDPAQHCCIDLAWFISNPIEHESQGENPVLLWIKSWNEYRINIPLGGNSSTLIRFCPWCGAKLPASTREEWYQQLHRLGFSDPGEQEIPSEFDSDAWWRTKD